MLYWRIISQTILLFEEEKGKPFLRGGEEQQGAGPLSTPAPAGVSGRVRHADRRIDLGRRPQANYFGKCCGKKKYLCVRHLPRTLASNVSGHLLLASVFCHPLSGQYNFLQQYKSTLQQLCQYFVFKQNCSKPFQYIMQFHQNHSFPGWGERHQFW